MTPTLTLQRMAFASLSREMLDEWQALLARSTRPSIYASHDYIRLALLYSQKDKATTWVLLCRDERGKLRAIFPFSLWLREVHGCQVRVLEHIITTHSSEVDKPYPIIDPQYENAAWSALAQYLKKEFTEWDWLEYLELIPETALAKRVGRWFALPRCVNLTRRGTDSPIVDLSQSRNEFLAAHRNLRKKRQRLFRQLPSAHFETLTAPEQMANAVAQYVALERRGWKAERGVSAPNNQAFYTALLQRLAERQQAVVSVLHADGLYIAMEISFCYGDTVYLAQGTYHPDYASFSPGSVCTGLSIEYFLQRGFKRGDFLAGFAAYANPLAAQIYPTQQLRVFKINGNFLRFALATLRAKIIQWWRPTHQSRAVAES